MATDGWTNQAVLPWEIRPSTEGILGQGPNARGLIQNALSEWYAFSGCHCSVLLLSECCEELAAVCDGLSSVHAL